METMIKVVRYRTVPYTVNFPTNSGGVKSYIWSGSKGKKLDEKQLPREVVDWLLINSRCFTEGELVIIEDTEDAKDAVESIDNIEEYKNNTHSREETEQLLTGNFNKMKSELAKITNKNEKKFFIEVAKEIGLDSNSKLKFLAEWYGVKKDILFDE